MKAEGKENKNSLLAICRSSEAAGGARSNCYEFFGSFCRYKKNEEKLLSPAANDNPELSQYYFNANHLGSGSLITDESGATYQTLAYAPHGELLVNEINGTYDEPYKFTGYERDQESGLDYAHARYREPDKTIFYSTDPMWSKYPHITPYNYCMNNPLNVIDLKGDSSAMLNMGSGLNQHSAMLVQNEQGKWQYYSVNGDNVYSSGQFSGGKQFNEVAVGEWNSPQKFLNSDFNTRATGAEKQTSTDINGYGFTEVFVIPTTPTQDRTIRETFTNIATTENYDLVGNNCATAVLRSFEAAGIQTYNTATNRTYVPANHKFGESGYWVTYPMSSRPFVPSSAFRSVMNYNRNGFLLRK